MEPLCVVRTPSTRALDKEVFWPLSFHKKNAKRRLAFPLVLFAIGFMLAVSNIIELFFIPWEYILEFFIFELIFWPTFLLIICLRVVQMLRWPRKYAREREKQRVQAVGSREVYTEILFFEQEFCFCSAISDGRITHTYRDVTAVDETDHYYIIYLTTGESMTFSKNGFIIGTPELAMYLLKGRVF